VQSRARPGVGQGAWKQCRVIQGTNQVVRAAAGGEVKYPSLPNGAPVTIEPVN